MKLIDLVKVIPDFQECSITIYKDKRVFLHFNCKKGSLDIEKYKDYTIKYVSCFMTCDYETILTITME